MELKRHYIVFLPWNDYFKVICPIHRLVTRRLAPLSLTQHPQVAWYRSLVACPAPSCKNTSHSTATLHTPTSSPLACNKKRDHSVVSVCSERQRQQRDQRRSCQTRRKGRRDSNVPDGRALAEGCRTGN